MRCPKCKSNTDVVDSRPLDNTVRRRRRCQACGHRFSTYEVEASMTTGKNNTGKIYLVTGDDLERTRRSMEEALRMVGRAQTVGTIKGG